MHGRTALRSSDLATASSALHLASAFLIRMDLHIDSTRLCVWPQVAQDRFVRQGLQVGLLCALVNNNSRCYDDAAEFSEHMGETLVDSCRVRTQG